MLTRPSAKGVLMWIVRLALRRPYTFVVLSLLLFFLGPVVIERTPVDIFPNIDIPVVSIIWSYAGLSPQQLSDRITVQFERSLTTTVNDIEHTESQTLNGIAVIKVYFRPTVNISQAVAQVTAIAQTALRAYPPGTTPPLIIQYSASSVPVLQLGLAGNGLTGQTTFAPGSPPCRGPPFPSHTEASSGRFRWISTPRSCRPSESPLPTW
jgi:multidrug efflux pump subunit AcrB